MSPTPAPIRKTRRTGAIGPCYSAGACPASTADGVSGPSGLSCRVGKEIAMLIFLAVTGAVVCCVLCGYGVFSAVRRSRERRAAHVH
jgi:hypothetical protein